MIVFKDLNKSEPYIKFKDSYDVALSKGQKAIEAINISSFNPKSNEVSSRFVNLKYIINDEWIFFSNYKSSKADDFINHNQISGCFYWLKTNTQIRIKGEIFITDRLISDSHYQKRSLEKNALSFCSRQSSKIPSYEEVRKNYESAINDAEKFSKRPDYWGGYSFRPYYFEFWKGHNSRLNKRDVYEKVENEWNHHVLQP